MVLNTIWEMMQFLQNIDKYDDAILADFKKKYPKVGSILEDKEDVKNIIFIVKQLNILTVLLAIAKRCPGAGIKGMDFSTLFNFAMDYVKHYLPGNLIFDDDVRKLKSFPNTSMLHEYIDYLIKNLEEVKEAKLEMFENLNCNLYLVQLANRNYSGLNFCPFSEN